LGDLFFVMCDEVAAKDWTEALQQLIHLLDDIAQKNFDCCHKFHQKATGRLGCRSALLHQGVIT
jgi:hypothetical protein